MPKNSLFTPLTSVSAVNHSWVPKQKLLEPVPPGVQREPSALCGVFHGQSSASGFLWSRAWETSSHPSFPLTFVPQLPLPSVHPPPPKLLLTSPAGFFKNRSCFLRWRFSFPCMCGIKAVCGAQSLSPFSLWNLLDLWQAASQ